MLVIGSGLHLHHSGQGKTALSDWNTLLDRVAESHGIFDEPYRSPFPTLTWERMVLACQRRDSAKALASDTETKMRKEVARLLKACSQNPCSNHGLGRSSSLRNVDAHVLNLNFDHLLDDHVGADWSLFREKSKLPALAGIPRSFRSNLFQRGQWISKKDMQCFIWHPHGSYLDANSIRLGLRDYGLLSAAVHQAFNNFKKWERSVSGRGQNKTPMTDRQYEKTLKALGELDASNPDLQDLSDHDHWVTRFMLSDVTFIGTGLSQDEIGLHWLLSQRARNFARIPATARPITKLITAETPQSGFFETERTASWESAWQAI